MRVKTEEYRNKIIDAALEVFREMGYGRASMSMISARMGGSKATLYGYFRSKEELFNAALLYSAEIQRAELHVLLDPATPNPAAVLRRFGEAYLRATTSKLAIALTRSAISEATTQQASKDHYRQGAKLILDVLGQYFSELTKRGEIYTEDPHLAAVHFDSLLYAGVLMPMLFGAKPKYSQKEAVSAACEAFLRAYAAETRPVAAPPEMPASDRKGRGAQAAAR